jgi:iron complex outermembrane receptor protein
MKNSASVFALVAASAFGFAASPAIAQDAAPDVRSPAAGGLEEIVVTARKREESIQDIPVSVIALSPEQIQRQDITSLEKLSSKLPQLVIARSANGSGASLSIRGLGSNFSSVGIEQSVAVIVDSAYYGHGRVLEEGFFDLAQIEMLKGPQALFFGKNATAGVISITTADPGSEAEYKVRAGYEFKAEEVFGEFVASGPVSDTLGIRVAVRASKMFGGYSTNLGSPVVYNVIDAATFTPSALVGPVSARKQPGTRQLIGRITVKWQPTDRLTNTLKLSATRSRGGSPVSNSYVGCSGPTFQGNPAIACGRKFTTYQNDPPPEFFGGTGTLKRGLYSMYDAYAINNALTYEFDDVTLASVTNYNYNKSRTNSDYAQQGNGGIWVPIDSRFRAFSNETRILTSFDGPVNVLAGVYYQSSKRKHAEDVTFFGAYNSAAPREVEYLAYNKPSGTKGETISGYGQLIWKVVPQVELTGGVRYTHETKKSFHIQPYVNPFFGGIFTPNKMLRKNQKFTNWSPDATITWKPDADIMVYAAYKTGYKSGGFSNSGIQGPGDPDGLNFVFGPEKAKGFEGGVKTTLLDKQLRLNLSAYRYNYSGLQVDYYDPVNVQYVTKNAGSARVEGVELEVDFAPRAVPGLTLRGTVNYNRARYREFVGPCYAGQSQTAGCNIFGPGADPATTLPTLQQLGGVATANAPNWVGTFGVDYQADVSDTLFFGIASDIRYSDRYNASAFNNPYSYQKSYVTLDASVRLGTTDGRWELAVIGKNLTNRQILTGVMEITGTGGGTGSVAGGPGADYFGYSSVPRTVMAQVSFKY